MSTQNLKAVVLAAGSGTRLMPITADRPKALVHVGEQTLLDRIAGQCAALGMREMIVVTGYKSESLDTWIESSNHDLQITSVFNAEYETINNAHSLWVARHAIGDAGFVKFDGDLLVHTAILRQLVDAAAPSALVIDSDVSLGDEEMKAQIDDASNVLGLGKWIVPAEAHGESIGVEKIAAADAPRVFDAIENLVHRDGQTDAYYEDAYHRLIEGGWELGSVDTQGLPWTEIDTRDDLALANRLVHELDSLN